MVGMRRLELPTPTSRTWCASQLRYIPRNRLQKYKNKFHINKCIVKYLSSEDGRQKTEFYFSRIQYPASRIKYPDNLFNFVLLKYTAPVV